MFDLSKLFNLKPRELKYTLWQQVFDNGIVGYVSKMKIGYMWELYLPDVDIAFKKGRKLFLSSALIKCHHVKAALPEKIESWEVLE